MVSSTTVSAYEPIRFATPPHTAFIVVDASGTIESFDDRTKRIFAYPEAEGRRT